MTERKMSSNSHQHQISMHLILNSGEHTLELEITGEHAYVIENFCINDTTVLLNRNKFHICEK